MNEITPANGALMSFIERAAKDPEFDVGKFGELLRLQRDVGHDQARRAFNAGMADAQSEMLPVVRDAKNSHLGNKYAKLETIDAALRPIYTRHGFSVRFGSAPAPTEGYIRITCTVAHSGGYFEENYLDAPIANTGSAGVAAPLPRACRRSAQPSPTCAGICWAWSSTSCWLMRTTTLREERHAALPAAAATPRARVRADPVVYDTAPDPLNEPDGRR